MQESGLAKYNKGLMKSWPEADRFDLPEASMEYSSLLYIWFLKARCHWCYTVGLVCFPCRGEQEIPIHKLQPFNDQPLYSKEGQKNHCSVINMHASWQNTPWQLPHCLGRAGPIFSLITKLTSSKVTIYKILAPDKLSVETSSETALML